MRDARCKVDALHASMRGEGRAGPSLAEQPDCQTSTPHSRDRCQNGRRAARRSMPCNRRAKTNPLYSKWGSRCLRLVRPADHRTWRSRRAATRLSASAKHCQNRSTALAAARQPQPGGLATSTIPQVSRRADFLESVSIPDWNSTKRRCPRDRLGDGQPRTGAAV